LPDKKGFLVVVQVVQRVQRYGRNCLLRRSLLSLMVSELMQDDENTPAAQGDAGASKENYPIKQQPRSYKYDDKGRPLMDSPNARAMMSVLRRLNVKGKTEVSRGDLAKVRYIVRWTCRVATGVLHVVSSRLFWQTRV
jgi:hypothetical protein